MVPRSLLCELPSLIARVAAVIGERSTTRPVGGGFALVEHVWHLADIEAEAFQVRLARLAREPAPWLPDFDGDRLARERDYLGRSLATGLRVLGRERRRTVAALLAIRGGAWLRGGIQEHVGYVTLGELPERMLAHDRSHAGELAALVDALRPGHPIAGDLRAWCAAIVEVPPSPCNRRAPVRARAASALPLARIQRAVAARVLAGDASPAALGRVLGLSPRTLQRRLAAHGLTVRCLVDAHVRALAVDRIRAGADWRVAAVELGFSDPRAFARAFKRWTQLTPSRFRAARAITRRGCA